MIYMSTVTNIWTVNNINDVNYVSCNIITSAAKLPQMYCTELTYCE